MGLPHQLPRPPQVPLGWLPKLGDPGPAPRQRLQGRRGDPLPVVRAMLQRAGLTGPAVASCEELSTLPGDLTLKSRVWVMAIMQRRPRDVLVGRSTCVLHSAL
ncbi:hypothetical protein H1C71_008100 [Ictidomys tridecemlineatus]|nr:hypothetical protein H1C71_008100 [Ictidomys tridecemlineatus]